MASASPLTRVALRHHTDSILDSSPSLEHGCWRTSHSPPVLWLQWAPTQLSRPQPPSGRHLSLQGQFWATVMVSDCTQAISLVCNAWGMVFGELKIRLKRSVYLRKAYLRLPAPNNGVAVRENTNESNWRVYARWWIALTPGLIVTKVKPWSLYSCAHCTVSMFSAALETLYDGTGIIEYRADISMEPTEVDLMSMFSID